MRSGGRSTATKSLQQEQRNVLTKQREGNLRNAQFSSGPRTPEGKAASARNAFKHGFCADDATLHDDPETSQEISARVTRYLDHFLPQSALEEATVTEIAFCEIRLEHLVRAETGLLNFYRQLAFQQHSFSDPAGNLFHKFDPVNHRPGDERHVANMLLGVAWRDAGPEIERMSRYESRLRIRYEKAIQRMDSLIAARPRQEPPAEPAPTPDPPIVRNEPNFDLNPNNATPIFSKSPAPSAPPATRPNLDLLGQASPASLPASPDARHPLTDPRPRKRSR